MARFDLDEEQSKQLIDDLYAPTSEETLKFWIEAIKEAKKIKKI